MCKYISSHYYLTKKLKPKKYTAKFTLLTKSTIIYRKIK